MHTSVYYSEQPYCQDSVTVAADLQLQVHTMRDAPDLTGRRLLQYYNDNDCEYYNNCNKWSGGRIAGVVLASIALCLAIVGLILRILRRRRLARTQVERYAL